MSSAYRVYSLDEEGLVVRARLIEARTDDDALDIARDLVRAGRGQLWTGTRLVTEFQDGSSEQSRAICDVAQTSPGVK